MVNLLHVTLTLTLTLLSYQMARSPTVSPLLVMKPSLPFDRNLHRCSGVCVWVYVFFSTCVCYRLATSYTVEMSYHVGHMCYHSEGLLVSVRNVNPLAESSRSCKTST